jgi:pantothenate kinase type III
MSTTICFDFGNTRLKAAIFKENELVEVVVLSKGDVAEIGELVNLKACVNYVGKSSMVVGIRVTSQNIQTGKVKHTNSSYFTMVAKNQDGENVQVPKLILSNLNEVRRFYESVNRISAKKEYLKEEITLDFSSKEALVNLENYNVILKL